MDGGDLSILEHLERLLPRGGRARRVVGWGVIAWALIGAAVVFGTLGGLLGRIAGVLPYLLTAGLVVFALDPAVRALGRRGVPRRPAATLVFVAAVLLVAAAVDLLVPVAVRQARELARTSPHLAAAGGLFGRLSRSPDLVLRRAGDVSSSWIRDHVGTVQHELDTLVSAGVGLVHAGLVLVLGGFLGFLLLLSLPRTAQGLLALIPPGRRERVEPVLREVRRIVAGYVRARLIVSLAVGAVATFGLWLIGMPFWLLLGFVVGVANLIPVLGSWIGGVPVALVALETKPPSFLLVVLVVIVVSHAIDGYLLSPIVLKGTTDLHPVVVLLAVLVGAEVAGFLGILAAIPVAGVAQFLVRDRVGAAAAAAGAGAPGAGREGG